MVKALAILALAASMVSASQSYDWDAAYQKAEAALKKLDNDDKAGIVTGVGWMNGPCVGNVSPVKKIGFPSLCMQDGPLGIRFNNGTTAFPAGVQAAMTWDTDLMYKRGNAHGTESKARGINVQLGPVAGPLGKIPNGGRNWEGFSPDPYLTGLAMQHTIEGMQDAGVQACAKHFIGNEQEKNRETMSSNIPDRTLHELYMWPFADAVKANVASIMCSYNQLNGTWACESEEVMQNLLKSQLKFRGFVMSDWNAQHSLEAANHGLDMTMPGSDFTGGNVFWGKNLVQAVKNGTVAQKQLDEMATRVLASWYVAGQDKGYPSVQWSSWNESHVPDVQGNHKEVARAVARDGIVLLKNTNGTLPLHKPSSLAVVGLDSVTDPAGRNACADQGCDNGTLAMGWGSGSVQLPYLVSPLDAIKSQAKKDGTKVYSSPSDDTTKGAAAAKKADTAIVFINSDSGEGYITVEGNAGDRLNLDPWHNGNDLVAAVAKVSHNVIVVAHSVGPVILEKILAQPSVKAIVWAGLPGQESGNALADILYGAHSPSGKLVYTIAKQESDYGTKVQAGDDSYDEGLYIDYRHFDHQNIAPRYEFGYGLSYTKFGYSGLKASKIDASNDDLFATVATVTATVRNTGRVQGKEVAQLYVQMPAGSPAGPPRQLRGFAKVDLRPGESRTVKFPLRRRDLSYWDVDAQEWVLGKGQFQVCVGASSRDRRLEGVLTN